MADMDRVSTGGSERLTQPKSALINVEAEITWIGRHLKGIAPLGGSVARSSS